jgi:hypothetical protein
MAKFVGRQIVKPAQPEPDGESDGSMSEGEIGLAAAAERKRSRNFQESWKEDNPWLHYSEVTMRMFCVFFR